MPPDIAHPIILASASAIRRQMLEAAGVPVSVIPAAVDERPIQMSYTGTNPAGIAGALARLKAEAVSRLHPEALVIGADQVLAHNNAVFQKPADLVQARLHLTWLCGQTHELHSAVAIAQDGAVVWGSIDSARLTMRAFSDAFLDAYIARAGPRICASVGAYELEGQGVQLFERIEGDYFTILGLPLLALLNELRLRGAIPS